MTTRFQWPRLFYPIMLVGVLIGIVACYAVLQSHPVKSSVPIEYSFAGPNHGQYWLRAQDESLLRLHCNSEKQIEQQSFRWSKRALNLGRIFSIDESTFITVRSSELKSRQGVYSHHAILGTAKDGMLTLNPHSEVEIGISELADPLFLQTASNKFASLLSWGWFGDYEVIELVVNPSQTPAITLQRRDNFKHLSGGLVGERHTPCVLATSWPNRLIAIHAKSATVIDLSTSTGDVKPIKGYMANTTRPLTMWADLSDDSLFLVTTEVSLPNDQDRRSVNLSIGIYELDEFEVKRQAKRELSLPLPVDLPETWIIDIQIPIRFVDHRTCLVATPIGWGSLAIDPSQETLSSTWELTPYEGAKESPSLWTVANYRDYIGIVGDSSRPFAIQRAPFNAQRGFCSAVFMGPIAIE